MLRIGLGVIGGFVAWMAVWIVSEKAIGAVFAAETRPLIPHIVFETTVSLLAGALAAVVAGENSKAPLIAGCLLLIMGIAKAIMSWQYVPNWYHVIFTAILLPMAIVGGKLITITSPQ